MKNLIRIDYDLSTIFNSFNHIYFAKNIGNLLVQLIGPNSN